MIIRPACHKDISELSRVHIETWRTTYLGIVADSFLDGLSLQKHIERHERLMAKLGTKYYVAEVEGTGIVSFLLGGPRRMEDMPFSAELYAIYILRKHARQGVGKALVRQWALDLREEGMNSAYVWVLSDNKPAIAFYEKLGGKFLREQILNIGEQSLQESAYGWDDLGILV